MVTGKRLGGLGLALLLASALSGPALSAGPAIGGCPIFPADNIWNARVDGLLTDPRSADYVASIGADAPLKADFGSGLYGGAPVGIPYVVVPRDQAMVPIRFAPFGDETEAIADESDPGPYPVPADAPIEGGSDATGDQHVLVVQAQSCTLYELYKAAPNADGSWHAVSSARFDLEGNVLRPDGWTSAHAAGLPIFPASCATRRWRRVKSPMRFTAPRTQSTYVWPARHFASHSDDAALPPLGQRFRLKANIDISSFSPANQVILWALQTYGVILADNGSPWFLSGAPNGAWDNDTLNAELRQLKGSDFEAVDVLSLMRNADSGQVVGP